MALARIKLFDVNRVIITTIKIREVHHTPIYSLAHIKINVLVWLIDINYKQFRLNVTL